VRNQLTHALPPNTTLVIRIDPPIEPIEKPYILTLRGSDSIVVEIIDPSRVEITNATKELAPFFFCIAKRPLAMLRDAIPPEWRQLLRSL
jgi:hypothetical protein